MTNLHFDDIQGIVFSTYGHLSASGFVLLEVTDAAAVKRWLGELLPDITSARRDDDSVSGAQTVVNVAFAFSGLEKLSVSGAAPGSIPNAFQDGTSSSDQQQRVGDIGDNGPEHWYWGGRQNPDVDLMLMVYAQDLEKLDDRIRQLLPDEECGVRTVKKSQAVLLKEGREHFGFRDGLSQPVIAGSGQESHPNDLIAAGEFILGYPNADGDVSPQMSLQRSSDGTAKSAKNGTFLVVRQLEQDVGAFWSWLQNSADDDDVDVSAVKLASKMVGRWPNGTPLSGNPDTPLEDNSPEISKWFGFSDQKDDLHCPVGAHIRRANPRDSLFNAPKVSVGFSNRHRILRRARPYGSPFLSETLPDGIQVESECPMAPSTDRGLLFMCLNTDIEKQFELVQGSWVNNSKFPDLFDEVDPLLGGNADGGNNNFTVPSQPFRERFTGLPRFIRVRGAEYFFLPGLDMLAWICGDRHETFSP